MIKKPGQFLLYVLVSLGCALVFWAGTGMVVQAGTSVRAETQAVPQADEQVSIYLPIVIGPAPDQVFNVSDIAGLTAAVQASNSFPSKRTLVHLAAGAYSFSQTQDAGDALPIIQGNLTILGDQAILDRASGAPAMRFFEIASAGSLFLDGVTLRGGAAVTGNLGGAIYNSGRFNITRSSFDSDTSEGYGGAIYSLGELWISNTSFSGNRSNLGEAVFIEQGPAEINASNFPGDQNETGKNEIFCANGCDLKIFHSNISNHKSYGVVNFGRLAVSHTLFSNNANNAINNSGQLSSTYNQYYENVGPAIENNYFRTDSDIVIQHDCFIANNVPGEGLAIHSTVPIQALNNWWGMPDGPSGVGPGSGDGLEANISYSPFLTALPAACLASPVIISRVVISFIGPVTYFGSPYVMQGAQLNISARVVGYNLPDKSVGWQITSGGGSLSGAAATQVLFTAPNVLDQTHIQATSNFDPSISAVLWIETAKVQLISNRQHGTVLVNGKLPLPIQNKIVTSGGGSYNIAELHFEIVNGGGSMQGFTYFAPAEPGTALVRFWPVLDPTQVKEVAVTIVDSGPHDCENHPFGDGPLTAEVSGGTSSPNYPVIKGFNILDNQGPLVGETQTWQVNLYVKDPADQPVTAVTVSLGLDDGLYGPYILTLASGTATNGAWVGSFPFPSTFCNYPGTNQAGFDIYIHAINGSFDNLLAGSIVFLQ